MSDTFSLSREYLSFHFNNLDDSRSSNRNRGLLDDQWDHYALFDEFAAALDGFFKIKFRKTPWPELVVSDRRYKKHLWKNRNSGGNKYLRFEMARYPSGFKIEFWYIGTRDPGRRPEEKGNYDLRKWERATWAERGFFVKFEEFARSFFLTKGCIDNTDTKLTGRAFVMHDINRGRSYRHWGPWESYKDEPYHRNHNARDRDKKLVENGQLKFYRDYWSGRLRCGIVYHNINNMWWVVDNRDHFTNIACFHLFDATPADLAYRRLKSDTSTPEQKARKKVGTKLYNELKAKGVKIVMEAQT
jgi:hypothetical protein